MNKITLRMKKLIKSLSLVAIFCISIIGYAQEDLPFERQTITPSQPTCIFHPSEYAGLISVLRSQEVIEKVASRITPCSDIIVSYNGFTPEAEAAFQYAIDIWEMSIESSVPINIIANFSDLGPGVLGSAGPVSYQTVDTNLAPDALPNTFYPKAVVEKLEVADTSPFGGSNDINANFSSTFNFYFGTDANPPAGQFDFVSVVLHELGHGLGFAGFGNVDTDTSIGDIRFNGISSIFDVFIENGTADSILSFPDPSIELGSQLTGEDLFCNSAIATGQNGGIAPRMFAPSAWDQGSSYSHWNESTFLPGNINSLMTPQIGPGEANHNPGPITLGFFEEMGWSVCGGSLTVDDYSLSSIEVSPNPFKSSIEIKLSNGLNDNYQLNIFDINGRIVLKESKTATNGTITISNLDELDDALYFVKITNTTNGSSITKKVIKN